MIVVTLSTCPPALRGDLTQWLFEIDTGVYVGHVSSRVREQLWTRICDHVKDGRATMVYSTNTEQRLAYRVHHTTWIPTDFDGLTLMLRPTAKPEKATEPPTPGKNFSRAAKFAMARRAERCKRAGNNLPKQERYAVIDIETTGLREDRDDMLEISALLVENGAVTATYQAYMARSTPIPPKITDLTGITDDMIRERGIPLSQALQEFLAFIGKAKLVSHNIAFDMKFITAACQKESLPPPMNPTEDTLRLARSLLHDLGNYRLTTVATRLGIQFPTAHTATSDCETTLAVYQALQTLKTQKQTQSNPPHAK